MSAEKPSEKPAEKPGEKPAEKGSEKTDKKQIIGHYELGKPLGKGAFSSVRECVDVQSGKTYAMKILDKKMLVDQKLGPQVNREIALLLKLSHRNVCTMRECFQTPNQVFIILEIVRGGDLFEKIKQAKKFEEPTARNYFQQLIVGLHYCHTHKVAHRDLKPENLLLDESGNLKISDFGLSNSQNATDSGRVNPSMMLNTVCGTPNYVSPEVLMEQGYNGFKADIWSAGVILYVMASGKLPFHDKIMQLLFKKIQTGSYQVPDHFSPELCTLLAKMMCVDPNKRATLEEIIQDPWFRVDWSDDRLKEGELKRSPSQENMKKVISELREKRQQEAQQRRNSASNASSGGSSSSSSTTTSTSPPPESLTKTQGNSAKPSSRPSSASPKRSAPSP